MTITEKIEYSLSRGCLNYRDITKIVELDKARYEASGRDYDEAVYYYGSQILEVLYRADMPIAERLSQAEKKRK